MADEEALHRCVTKFMIDTCRHSTSEYATFISFCPLTVRVGGSSADILPADVFMSGSSAEFRIQPMLSCIDDIDIMAVYNFFLAIPRGYTPPIQLPARYECTVCAFEIMESHQPGYVYLEPLYVLRKTDNDRYIAEKADEENKVYFDPGRDNSELNLNIPYQLQYMMPAIHATSVQSLLTPVAARRGPAIKGVYNRNIKKLQKPTDHRLSFSSMDIVPCVRCLHWPPQASNWPTRHRDHGWPDQTTINSVVNNGCDVVGAVYSRCKQDEWMGKYQWRLSFSRAEVTLLNSWTPVQQIIYHMLRFVMKSKVFAKTKDKEQCAQKLSNYHLKTLMLWECEQKPQSWWSAESSLVKLCSSVLRKLSGWINEKCCHHYFINDCNILDDLVDDASSLTIHSSLKSLADDSVLLSWFVENYIRKCAECCPTEVSILFQDTCCYDKLETSVQAVIDWKRSTMPKDLYTEHWNNEAMIHTIILLFRSDAVAIIMLMKELQNFSQRHRDYFVALTSLRAAYTISIHSVTEDLLEILWTLFGPITAEVGKYESGGLLPIRKAIKLARLHNVDSNNALQMLYQEISKTYLHQSLAYGHVSTHCLVHVLLATLYYKSGHFQSAANHCKQVLNQSLRSHHRPQSIGAEYLPQIDDNVDSVFGLVILYRYVQGSGLNGSVYPEEINKPSLTTLLLAHYVHSQCQTAANRKCNQMTKYRQHLSKTQHLLLCDVLLFKECTEQCTEIPAVNTGTADSDHESSSSDPSLLVTTLELVALEKLITFRQVIVRELHSEQFPILNEFEALYSYKCGLFEECLEMCRNHVNMLLRAGCSRNQRYVTALPQAVSLLDGDLVSLFGIIGILYPVLFLFLIQFPDSGELSVLTLSLYLMVQCQKKLNEDSFDDTLQLIRFVHDKMYPADDNEYLLDRLILKLTYRSLKLYIDDVPLS